MAGRYEVMRLQCQAIFCWAVYLHHIIYDFMLFRVWISNQIFKVLHQIVPNVAISCPDFFLSFVFLLKALNASAHRNQKFSKSQKNFQTFSWFKENNWLLTYANDASMYLDHPCYLLSSLNLISGPLFIYRKIVNCFIFNKFS